MTEPIHIISLGAGVQSSAMALMASAGEITPMPQCAIFADTQAEPKSVYEWLIWLEKQLPFPVHHVTAGSLYESEMRIIRSKKSGRLYRKNSIPAFVLKPNGQKGLLGRACTLDFKINPLIKKAREIVGVKRDCGPVRVIVWIGISTDEAHRMKPSRKKFIENRWPLIDSGLSRKSCLKWMKDKGFPEPPRSACFFCPFHSDEEWLRLKNQEPESWTRAVEFERELIDAHSKQEVLVGTPYLHESCKSLEDVEFRDNKGRGQLDLFGNECEGLCGV